MEHEHHAKLSHCDHSRTGPTSRESLSGKEWAGDEEGDCPAIEPASAKSLSGLFATLKPIQDSFEPIEDIPPDPVDL